MDANIDIVGIGNAIVDVLAETADDFLARHGLARGAMALVDGGRAAALTDALVAEATGSVARRSGGSVANSCVVASLLGARVAYLGSVAADELGRAFRADIEAAGVLFPTPPRTDAGDTGRCLIAVTPDGQRTMSTFLGAANRFAGADLDPALIESAAITYLEGYLFDPPDAQNAFRAAAAIARNAERTVALSLSDRFCVERHRDSFAAFVRDDADIVFANEAELTALYDAPFDQALDRLGRDVRIGVATRGAAGSVIVAGGARHAIDAAPATVRDTTGAGDAFAAGFLAALVQARPLPEAGLLGARAAAVVIGIMGARPDGEDPAMVTLRGG